MKKRLALLLSWFGAVGLAAACAQPPAVAPTATSAPMATAEATLAPLPPAETPAPTADPATLGYPAPAAGADSYPGPVIDTASITPVPPANVPAPAPDKATVSGVLYSFTIERVVPGTAFYLTPGMGDDQKLVPLVFFGAETEADVPAMSNGQGQFVLENIEPGNYYMAVWSPGTYVLGVEEDDTTRPLLIELKPGEHLDLGVVYLGWP